MIICCTLVSLSLSFYRYAKVESAKATFRPVKSFQISDDALNPEALSLFLSFFIVKQSLSFYLASVATGSFLIGLTGSLAACAPPCCCAFIAACAVGKLCNNCNVIFCTYAYAIFEYENMTSPTFACVSSILRSIKPSCFDNVGATNLS